MNDLFGSIFGLFQNIYGIPLSNFMYEDGRLYSQIGMAMVVVSIVVCAVFYYVINHPALNSWKGWGMSLLINSVINFLMSWLRVLVIYNSGAMVETNLSNGEAVPIDVSTFDIVNFGVATAIVSAVFYVLISFFIKRKSVNCSHYPHIK